MYKFKIRTTLELVKTNETIDLGSIGDIIDFSLKNIGSDNLIVFINGVPFPVDVGDSLIALGGYNNALRTDIIKIQFEDVNEDQQAMCFMTKVLNLNSCK